MELHHRDKGDAGRATHIESHFRALRGGRFEKNLEARVGAARFEMYLGNFGRAGEDMGYALKHLGGEDNPDALLAVAELELKSIKDAAEAPKRLAEAERRLKKAFGIDPKNVAVGIKYADVLSRQGRREDSAGVLERTAAALPPGDPQNLLVIDQLLDFGEQKVSASLVESRLAPDDNRRVFVTYFRGRLALLRQDWMAALKLLEECAQPLARAPSYHKKVMVGIASCFAAMQNPDKQLEFCQKALADDGGYALAVIGKAEALVRMGKLEDALRQYRVIVYTFQLVGYRNELARLELLDVLAQPGEAASRDWRAFENSLGPAKDRAPELRVFDAESLVARGRAAEAAKALEEWLAANPKDPKAAQVWVALARIKDGGKAEGAWATLDEAQKQVGDTVEIRLARAGLLAARPAPPAPADFE
jgi:tetratricopeptide (TPR) repeat protein